MTGCSFFSLCAAAETDEYEILDPEAANAGWKCKMGMGFSLLIIGGAGIAVSQLAIEDAVAQHAVFAGGLVVAIVGLLLIIQALREFCKSVNYDSESQTSATELRAQRRRSSRSVSGNDIKDDVDPGLTRSSSGRKLATQNDDGESLQRTASLTRGAVQST